MTIGGSKNTSGIQYCYSRRWRFSCLMDLVPGPCFRGHEPHAEQLQAMRQASCCSWQLTSWGSPGLVHPGRPLFSRWLKVMGDFGFCGKARNHMYHTISSEERREEVRNKGEKTRSHATFVILEAEETGTGTCSIYCLHGKPFHHALGILIHMCKVI